MERYGSAQPILSKLIINRIDLEKTAKDKIPFLYEHGVLFDRRSLEQCTSEDVARFKATILKGQNLLVLAGGLGIDEWALSKSFDQVISVELNDELNDIVNLNFNELGINNITRVTDRAEKYISNVSGHFDWIFCDPDRRDEHGRQILLIDHQPDIVQIQSRLFELADHLAIKASPLYDYEMALKELKHVSELYAISRKGEMKELLIICDKQHTDEQAVLLHSVDISDGIRSFTCQMGQLSLPEPGSPDAPYFFEAGNALVKMRTHAAYAHEQGLELTDVSVPYYLGQHAIDNFLGRQFRLIDSFEFNSKSLKQYLEKQGIVKLNLKLRGLRYSTSEILRNLKLKEGGEDYVFILPFQQKAMVFHCRKI